jgi:hypothetical protein
MTDSTAQSSGNVLVLTRCRADDPGHLFGLRGGDVLLGVDGHLWSGTSRALARHFTRQRRAVLLTFQRGEVVFSVLSERSDLGWWTMQPRPAALASLPEMTAPLGMWEIVAQPSGAHDLFCLQRSWLALITPPLWLAQARLWPGLALFAAAMALCLPVGPVLAMLVWIAAGLHLWQAGPDHRRVALQVQGYSRRARIAAPSEAAAIATWTMLSPKARFRYAPAPTPVAASNPDLGSEPL